MTKDDFKYGMPKYYIEDKYVFDSQDYLITISEDIFDEKTVEYANRIIEKFKKEKNEIFDYMLERRLRKVYGSTYSDEYIKNNLGKPQINIDFKNDDIRSNRKFEYEGSIDFCEGKLDGHIISIEFLDDLKLIGDVQMNG